MTSEIEIKLFQPSKEFRNYFKIISATYEHVGKYSWAVISVWNNFQLISGKFPRAKIELFQMDVDKLQ